MKKLRLILGDQLNASHSWFNTVDDNILYVMMEIKQETGYVVHHAQKVIAIFAAMRAFKDMLLAQGHQVLYLTINDPENAHDFNQNLNRIIRVQKIDQFTFQAPDEYRVDQLLDIVVNQLSIPAKKISSQHFLTDRGEAARFFGDGKWLMERFYRHMRVKHQILLDDKQKPVGGKWNYDKENRKKWTGKPTVPADTRPMHNHSALWDEISSQAITTMGAPTADAFRWPIDRAESLAVLDYFIEHNLGHFGDYQDAMHTDNFRLFHSLISFSLNVKMLSPDEVIAKAEQAYAEKDYPLAAVEGFIRQILGWREFVRGFYWAHMPTLEQANFFEQEKPLPSWFWDGNTKMNCLKHSITQSLDHAYAHHIQRLMVIGNFALLMGFDTKAVHQWYLGIYIDAFEWVEMPNTLSMSQYADGGLLATKPYVSSGAYINKMSNYCGGCAYSYKTRIGENACPFNSLYWDFFQKQKTKLENNPRLGIVNMQLQKMSDADKEAVSQQAALYKNDVENI
jgi:deoxyribodipyrimidine photolyase-related protein